MSTNEILKLEKTKQATAHDVARLAGVARPTVSAVLNGARSNTVVSAATRERIMAAASELGYRPNLMARGMKSGRSYVIGVLVRNNSRLDPDESLSHPLAYELVLGISEGLEEAGYMMSFVRLSDVDPEKHEQSSAFQGHLLDGLIVVSDVPAARADRLEELVPHCVWLDANVWRDENCIRRDERHAGETVARELAALGYWQWVMLTRPDEPPPHYSYPERLAGLQKGAKDCGATLRLHTLDWVRPDLATLWPQLNREVALIAMDIYAAYKILYAAPQANLCIGRDFALASCDDGGSMGWNELARVSFRRFTFGIEAARMMIHRINEPEAPATSRRVQGEWISGTTAPRLAK